MSYRFPVGHGRDPQRAGRPVGDLSPQRACPLGVERIRLESIRRPMQRSQRGRRGQPGKRASPAAEDVADESGSVDGQVQRLPSAHVVQRQSDGSAVDHSGEGPYGVHRHQPGVLGLLDPICLAVRDLGDNVNLALRRTDQVQSLLRGHVVAEDNLLQMRAADLVPVLRVGGESHPSSAVLALHPGGCERLGLDHRELCLNPRVPLDEGERSGAPRAWCVNNLPMAFAALVAGVAESEVAPEP